MNTAMQTALIVDDESLIAMSAADLFQAAGYETIEAS
jgi:CheY-like chemotaxis protein